jgi:hypothetical protein
MTTLDNATEMHAQTGTPHDRLGLLMNSGEVATMVRVPQATLRYWRHVGIGPRSFKMGPRRVLYRVDDVLEWVAGQYDSQD